MIAALVLGASVAVASPAASSRRYVCFFDAGSAELSPRCQAIVLEFAAWWHRAKHGEERSRQDEAPGPARAMQVIVGGHVDLPEAAAGKASLSRTRAEAVAALLKLNGVPAEVITVAAFGADRPLVPWDRPEPQNRRVALDTK